MPVEVQGPDGNIYQFPDGITKEVAVAYFKRKLGTKTPTAQIEANPPAVPKPQVLKTGLEGYHEGGYGPVSQGDLANSLFANSDEFGKRAALVLAPEAGAIATKGLPLAARMFGQAVGGAAGGKISGMSNAESAGVGAVAGAIPAIGPAARAIGSKIPGTAPYMAQASAKFQQVMGAARGQPVEVKESGNVAARIWDMSQRGGSRPKVITDFVKRMTDPEKGPLTYEEARDFYSNASKLSADEMKRLTPKLRFEVTKFARALDAEIRATAGAAGKGEQYGQAMREYAKGAKVKGIASKAFEKGVKALPYAGGAYAANEILKGR